MSNFSILFKCILILSTDLRRSIFGKVCSSSAQLRSVTGRFCKPSPSFMSLLTPSLGYSVLTYLLQIKDRHNGNLLIDREGHLIHIDWGFILESSPGGNLGFEAAPFKLPLEYIEVLGGLDSEPWKEFKSLVREGFEAVRKHCDSIVSECRFLRLLSR
jgi:phosphatidylinositol 4-kinase B